jgi:hypothetical protein
LRRRPVDELEELPARFARADGGGVADLHRVAPSRSAAAPNKAGR